MRRHIIVALAAFQTLGAGTAPADSRWRVQDLRRVHYDLETDAITSGAGRSTSEYTVWDSTQHAFYFMTPQADRLWLDWADLPSVRALSTIEIGYGTNRVEPTRLDLVLYSHENGFDSNQRIVEAVYRLRELPGSPTAPDPTGWIVTLSLPERLRVSGPDLDDDDLIDFGYSYGFPVALGTDERLGPILAGDPNGTLGMENYIDDFVASPGGDPNDLRLPGVNTDYYTTWCFYSPSAQFYLSLMSDVPSCSSNGCERADIEPLDGDCDVDVGDLAILLTNFGASGATRDQGDIDPPDGDGVVGLADLAQMLAEFGAGCADCDWTPMAAGLADRVNALTSTPGPAPRVFAASGINPIGRVSSWDGDDWTLIGEINVGEINALLVDTASPTPLLYAGGAFVRINGVHVRYVASWDGAQWSPVGDWPTQQPVYAMTFFDDGAGRKLYAGGEGGVYVFDGGAWSLVGATDRSTYAVFALCEFEGHLVAAGNFDGIGGVAADAVGRWNGASWAPLGAGLGGSVNALAVFDDGGAPALYAAGGNAHVTKWNGASWVAVGGGTNDRVRALTAFDDGNGPALYAGGDFVMAGGRYTRAIARWDGLEWAPVKTGLDDNVTSLAAFGPTELVAGGRFMSAGTAPASRVARWRCP